MRIETSRLSRAAALLLASVMAVGTLSGCGSIGRHPPAPKSAETPDHRYKIGPLDTLNIVVWRNPELSATVTVRPDGRISTPLVEDLQASGKNIIDAALEAAHLRFRPIIMTSLAFTLGVLPLFLATGASSASQRAIGTGVIGGMITGTALAVVFVPVFFVLVRSFFKGSRRQQEHDANQAMQHHSGSAH